jgi:hypothetical protein
MRKNIRAILLILLAALVLIQFIRPQKNISGSIDGRDITAKYVVPAGVLDILKTSCYDCHSNNTRYPWYWEVQPVMWYMNGHIAEAKRGLNFSIFASYAIRKQYKLFDNIEKEVKEGGMPLGSYTLIHRDAVLSDAQKLLIANWATASRKEIEAHYPPDSLVKKAP